MIYFTIALLISILVNQFSGSVITIARKKVFELQRQGEYAPPTLEVLGKNCPGSIYSSTYDAMGSVSRQLHTIAVQQQNKYQETLFGMAALLFISLFSLVWVAAFSKPIALKYTFVWVEVFCLLLLLRKYILSRKQISDWVRSRAKAELVREARFITAFFGDPEIDTQELLSNLEKQATEIAEAIDGAGDQKLLLETIRSTSEQLIGCLHQKRRQLSYGDANSYLHRRIGRQLNWFTASSRRLHQEVERGTSLAAAVFGATLLLAILKVYLVYYPGSVGIVSVEIATFTLLLAASTSAALIYHSTGRGTGALSLRYATQANRIKDLVAKSGYVTNQNVNTLLPTDVADRFDMLVKEFETLSNEELIEWALVTQRYSAELG